MTKPGRSSAGRPAHVADVVIVGGGIVGCSAAAFLAEAGLGVVLVEGTGLASGASGANSGVIQHPAETVLAPLYEETIDLYRRLSDEDAGFRLPAEPAGLLLVASGGSPDDRLGRVQRLAAAIDREFPEQRPEVLDEAVLRAAEPGLAPELAACRVQIGYPVPPAASTYAYATVAERRGAVIRTGRRASLVLDGDRVVGVRVGGRHVGAGHVLVAAGPWTPELLDPTGAWRPIRRLWGVLVDVELASPPGHVIEEAGIESDLNGPDAVSVAHDHSGDAHDASGRPVARTFSLRTAAGVSAVGSTFLPHEPDPAAWVEPLLARGARFVPGITGAPIQGVRSCARPRSLDGRPLVGPVPGLEGVVVCAGHGPWGLSIGPATARMAADLILGRPAAMAPELRADRYGSPRSAPVHAPS
jgi:glycine/D-amino acid oxidase-like deaminating enzyme